MTPTLSFIGFVCRGVARVRLSTPGGQESNISLIFPHSPRFSLSFLNFSSFSSSIWGSGWVDPRRPWLRHCLYAYMLYLWSCGRATWCSIALSMAMPMWSTIFKLSKFDNKPAKFIVIARPSVWSHHYHTVMTVNQSTMYRITYLHKKKIPAVYSQSVEFIRSAQWTYLPSPVITLCVQNEPGNKSTKSFNQLYNNY